MVQRPDDSGYVVDNIAGVIKREVERAFDVSAELFCGKVGGGEVILARQAAHVIASEYMTLQKCGEIFGLVRHGTVLHSRKRHKINMMINKNYASMFNSLENSVAEWGFKKRIR